MNGAIKSHSPFWQLEAPDEYEPIHTIWYRPDSDPHTTLGDHLLYLDATEGDQPVYQLTPRALEQLLLCAGYTPVTIQGENTA